MVSFTGVIPAKKNDKMGMRGYMSWAEPGGWRKLEAFENLEEREEWRRAETTVAKMTDIELDEVSRWITLNEQLESARKRDYMYDSWMGVYRWEDLNRLHHLWDDIIEAEVALAKMSATKKNAPMKWKAAVKLYWDRMN